MRHNKGVSEHLPAGVKIVYQHWYFRMPWMKAYRGMVWGRTILFRHGPRDVPPMLLKHELVHIEQINRYGIIGFYLRYVGIYFRNLWRYRSFWKAYFEHPYEIEAREKSLEPD